MQDGRTNLRDILQAYHEEVQAYVRLVNPHSKPPGDGISNLNSAEATLILQSLFFKEMFSRRDTISKTYLKTYKWILEPWTDEITDKNASLS
jgi:hypothetical protein